MIDQIKRLRFSGGMNNVTQQTALPDGTARRIVNMDVMDNGVLKTRSGTTKVYEGDCHDLWSCDLGSFFVDSGNLMRVEGITNGVMEASVIRLGVGDLPMSYCVAGQHVFYANGLAMGKIDADGNVLFWGGSDYIGEDGRAYIAPPAGEIVRHFNGRIYIAKGAFLIATEPFRYDYTQPATSFLKMRGQITLLEPVSGGLFVGTDAGVVFLRGSDIANFSQSTADVVQPIPGSGITANGELFGVPGNSVAIWMGAMDGWVIGYPDGSVKHPASGRIATPAYKRAASLVREFDGTNQLMSLGRDPIQGSAMTAIDTVTTEVIRGGRLVV